MNRNVVIFPISNPSSPRSINAISHLGIDERLLPVASPPPQLGSLCEMDYSSPLGPADSTGDSRVLSVLGTVLPVLLVIISSQLSRSSSRTL